MSSLTFDFQPAMPPCLTTRDLRAGDLIHLLPPGCASPCLLYVKENGANCTGTVLAVDLAHALDPHYLTDQSLRAWKARRVKAKVVVEAYP